MRANVSRVARPPKKDPRKNVNAKGDRMRNAREPDAQHTIWLATVAVAFHPALPFPTTRYRILNDVVQQPASERKSKSFIAL
jgi:hypothetical protein